MKVKLLSSGARTPVRTNDHAAGYDVFVPVDSIVNPGRNVIPLDFQIELDPGTEAAMRPRSGFSVNGMEGYRCANDNNPSRFDADVILGTVDEDFRGCVGVIIKSYETKPFILKAGTKIAQLVISKYIGDEIEVVESLSNTERGEGGFGHTGTK